MKPIVTTFILYVCLSFDVFAQGDLIVTPNRVVFEGRKQKEELNLVNIGKETTTFSVSFVQKRMKEDGSFENISVPDSGQMFADPYLRIYPRQVTLAPGEPQVVMIQCRRKPDMPDGEYRSHLYFRSEKKYSPLGAKTPETDDNSVTVQVIPIFGISIPIIIRSGTVNVSSELSDLKLETDNVNNNTLNFILHRKGNISVYGNLNVEYLPEHGNPTKVGGKNGVAVYTNLSKRIVSIKLEIPPGINLKTGKLKLSFTSSEEEKFVLFAEAELVLK